MPIDGVVMRFSLNQSTEVRNTSVLKHQKVTNNSCRKTTPKIAYKKRVKKRNIIRIKMDEVHNTNEATNTRS